MFMFEAFQEMYKLLREAETDSACLKSDRTKEVMVEAERILRKHGKDPANLPNHSSLISSLNKL
jgi:hypothetical protein